MIIDIKEESLIIQETRFYSISHIRDPYLPNFRAFKILNYI